MNIQMCTSQFNMYLREIFKNVTNKNGYNLINQKIQIKILLSDYIFIGNKFFYRNYENEKEIIYVTNDKLNSIKIEDIKLSYEMIKLDKKYIYNCCKKYKKRKYLFKRINKITGEILRVNSIETKIKIEIINNLNFKKSQKNSHYRNCENKILGKNSYTKSLFLYQLHTINDNSKTNLINIINKTLKINIDTNIDLN